MNFLKSPGESEIHDYAMAFIDHYIRRLYYYFFVNIALIHRWDITPRKCIDILCLTTIFLLHYKKKIIVFLINTVFLKVI